MVQACSDTIATLYYNVILLRRVALLSSSNSGGEVGPYYKQMLEEIRGQFETATATIDPETKEVTKANADELWTQRRQWFFKPTCGFGSKAAYRGAKLTKRVWQDVVNGSYVAQALTPPSERMSDDELKPLKYDVRLYTYAAKPLLVTARLYRGQTTNFRTEQGGFAPVIVVREDI